MEETKRSIILVAFGFSLFLVILGILFTPRLKEVGVGQNEPSETTSVKVVSVEPLEEQKNVSASPDIRVVFTRNLDRGKLTIESIPEVKFQLARYDKNKYEAIFRPAKALSSGKKYTVNLKFSDQPLFLWKFTVKNFSSKDKNLASKAKKIKESIPRKTSNHVISYDAATDGFVVYINKGDYLTEKNKAEMWFRSFGISNLSALNISFIPRAAVRGDF